MTLKRKYDFYRMMLTLFLPILAMTTMAACDDDDEPACRVRLDASRPVSATESGAAVLVVSGPSGTAWTAEITIGGDWISFNDTAPGDQTVATGVIGSDVSEKYRFVYYWPNTTEEERHALIVFAFGNGTRVEVPLAQFAAGGSRDVYEAGRDRVWPEIPAKQETNTAYARVENLTYITHTALMNGQSARNYTMCFDKTKAGAWWVAYPITPTGYTGSIGRPSKWYYDPQIDAQYQADLENRSYPDPLYDRGHQIPNADRNGIAEMQSQTFYCSNSTPQNATLNQGPWAKLEEQVRKTWACSDTLYVVTGAVWQTSQTTPDIDGKACPVPTYYFKVLLRTADGNTRRAGDRMGDYSASQLKSVGFWTANTSNSGTYTNWATTVADIEQKTGFEFFPTVPAEVKNQQPAQWGGL